MAERMKSEASGNEFLLPAVHKRRRNERRQFSPPSAVHLEENRRGSSSGGAAGANLHHYLSCSRGSSFYLPDGWMKAPGPGGESSAQIGNIPQLREKELERRIVRRHSAA